MKGSLVEGPRFESKGPYHDPQDTHPSTLNNGMYLNATCWSVLWCPSCKCSQSQRKHDMITVWGYTVEQQQQSKTQIPRAQTSGPWLAGALVKGSRMTGVDPKQQRIAAKLATACRMLIRVTGLSCNHPQSLRILCTPFQRFLSPACLLSHAFPTGT